MLTDTELKDLDVLIRLSRPLSSRRIINCLKFDDMVERVSGILGKKPGRDWFNLAKTDPAEVLGTSTVNTLPGAEPVIVIENRPPSPEQNLTRKRKAIQTTKNPKPSQKAKGKMEMVDPEANRDLPGGMWDPGFSLSHKVEFNFDDAEQKVMSETNEQKMAENCLEFLLRGSAAAYNLVYASNRGPLKAEVDRLTKELRELKITHSVCEQKASEAAREITEGRQTMEDLKKTNTELKNSNEGLTGDLEVAKETIVSLTSDRDNLRHTVNVLKQTIEADKSLKQEMLAAIVDEHTKGFRKALRQMAFLTEVSPEGLGFDIDQDVYEGKMVPIGTIPEGTFTADGALMSLEEVETTMNVDIAEVVEEGPSGAA